MTNEIQQLLSVAIPPALSYLAAHIVQWKKYTTKFHQFREAVDDVDDSVTNPQVSEAQFQKDWSDFKALIS